ncbi:iron chelate uptake ABC transporter family permease subunit [Isoptericola variabilis]|uniref:ABC-type transporter, integral membrane subunit n=1 Tax=Isoptericola variabilis (strain 225) TaxID=743718 RepID=F6FXH4_ISOV2|nr:iron ABC transporter permease [Isoptericola variabilis]AEG44702.1 ABC-type transporter, integral membrane subunit [Isoptericola variabilis 225]TWH33439.1 iron complex transport system permease protein [Isoptericola variabilis J7]
MTTTLPGTPAPAPVPATTPVAALRARRRRRLALVLVTLAALLVALATLALTLGAASLPAPRALLALLGLGDPQETFIVQRLRLPRIEAAVLAGASFGLAGALFQSTLRNPLASPDILGIASGASLGAVWALLVAGLTGFAVSGAAFLGALAVAFCIWFFAWRQGLHSIRFVLVGVGFAYLCSSLLAWLLANAEVREAQSALLWTVGSVADVRGTQLGTLAAGFVALAAVATVVGRWQGPLALGDDHARGLGVPVDLARVGSLLLAVGLVALATSFVGPLAFVALVAPAIARRLVDDGGPALTASALTGAALVLAADVAGQHGLFFGVSAPTGIVTGLVGAPYLLWLLATHGRKSQA